ncbi:MAG: hypothetical protein AB7F64_06735 [Gammaproteobacteria bacterium]
MAGPILGFLGEDKTQKFLMKLVEHLRATRLMVYIDESQEGAKQQIHDFQRRILDVDHVLVFCSRTLYYKFHCMKRVGAVSEFELYANYEFRSPPDHVIPLQWNKTFYGPPTVKTHDAGINIYEDVYLKAFTTLLKRVYGFGKNFDRWYEQQPLRKDFSILKIMRLAI